MMYYQIIRADGSSKNYKIFSEMLDDFDRQDVVDLYSLVKERAHVLLMDTGVAIYMMVEMKYPLTQEMLSRMLNRRLEVDHERINSVHDTFHMSNLKKCLADRTLQIPLDEMKVDARLNFVEEPVEILEREFKKIKRSRIAIVKVQWNSKRGPEFMWEREDQIKLKYPHL
ncbi:hypothetical protein Tco_1154072 [Tanacetum coccineum]